LPWLLERANVIHQCRVALVTPMREAVGQQPTKLAARYLVTGFIGPELSDVLALADMVSRKAVRARSRS
jgi:UDP-N-acetylglucosamine--N-acetylmuramyl-(pentapeptide) pyrophosphoryl-undecaprenol N-acetylglucosamine transferase